MKSERERSTLDLYEKNCDSRIEQVKHEIIYIFKNGPIPASFGLFSSFPHYTI